MTNKCYLCANTVEIEEHNSVWVVIKELNSSQKIQLEKFLFVPYLIADDYSSLNRFSKMSHDEDGKVVFCKNCLRKRIKSVNGTKG